MPSLITRMGRPGARKQNVPMRPSARSASHGVLGRLQHYPPINGHRERDVSERCHNRTHAPQQSVALLDHIVGAGQEHGKHREKTEVSFEFRSARQSQSVSAGAVPTGRLERCELRDRDLPQVISSTLKASIGRCKPLSVSSPTGSAVAVPSRAARTLPSIKIWPSRASAQRRAARLTTVPIAL